MPPTKMIFNDATDYWPNFTTSEHGLCPAGTSDTTKFLRGDGTFAVPGASTSGVTTTVFTAVLGLTDVISNTTAETNFATNYTIPANTAAANDFYRYRFYGIFATDAVVPTNLRLRFTNSGSVAMLDSGYGFSGTTLGVGISSQPWSFFADVAVMAAGASGEVEGHGRYNIRSAAGTEVSGEMGYGNAIGAGYAIDWTAGQAIKLSATFSVADADNKIWLNLMTVEKMRA